MPGQITKDTFSLGQYETQRETLKRLLAWINTTGKTQTEILRNKVPCLRCMDTSFVHIEFVMMDAKATFQWIFRFAPFHIFYEIKSGIWNFVLKSNLWLYITCVGGGIFEW